MSDHRDDLIESLLLSMLFSGKTRSMYSFSGSEACPNTAASS